MLVGKGGPPLSEPEGRVAGSLTMGEVVVVGAGLSWYGGPGDREGGWMGGMVGEVEGFDVGLAWVGDGHRVVVEVLVRVRVVAGEGDGSSVWGRGRAVVVGRREARSRRLREERIESRDMVVFLSC